MEVYMTLVASSEFEIAVLLIKILSCLACWTRREAEVSHMTFETISRQRDTNKSM